MQLPLSPELQIEEEDEEEDEEEESLDRELPILVSRFQQQLRNIINKAFEVFNLRAENKELVKSLLRVNEQLEFLLRQKLLS